MLTSSNNAQHLLTIDKDIALVTSPLKSVSYNGGTTVVTSGTLLGGFLYKQNVIEFKSLTSNIVVFNF